MQPCSREMQAMPSCLTDAGSGAAQIALQDLQNAAASDDFFDQMLSGLPSSWPDLGNPKSPWDLAGAAKPPEESPAPEYSATYDESSLLASRLRQHQISGGAGSPAAKPIALQLAQQQQQLLLSSAMGRSIAEAVSDQGGDRMYNGFGGGSMQNQQHFQSGTMPSQNFTGSPASGGQQQAPPAAAPPRQRVRARRGQATDPHSIAERLRRERIAERMKALQELVPNANKTDKASMLDEIIDYVKFLQLQVKVLSMSRLGGAAAVAPLVADISSEGRGGGGGGVVAAANDSLAATEHQVAKLMEEDMGSAMQYLQGKGLCLMPISLASAISSATARPGTAAHHIAGGANPGIIPALLNNNINNGGGDGPPSPSMSVLTAQSVMATSSDNIKDAASVSKQ